MLTQAVYEVLERTFPVMNGLAGPVRESVSKVGEHQLVPARAVLFEDGDACRWFPLVLRGSVRVVKSSAEGREMSLYRIEPGQFCLLTSSCLLGRAAYSARAEAREASELVLLPPACFEQLLDGHAPFRTMVFGLFSERLAELMQLVEEVAFRRLDQRLASLLVSRGPEICASHQKLADELGSVRVIISRILGSFEERGWVSLGRERVQILDREALARLAAGGC